MTRHEKEMEEMELELCEDIEVAKDVFERAERLKNPCLAEAKEWLEIKIYLLGIFKQLSTLEDEKLSEKLHEVEIHFTVSLAEFLASKEIKSYPDKSAEELLSPVFAYNKSGRPRFSPTFNKLRARINLLEQKRFILEWLLHKN